MRLGNEKTHVLRRLRMSRKHEKTHVLWNLRVLRKTYDLPGLGRVHEHGKTEAMRMLQMAGIVEKHV